MRPEMEARIRLALEESADLKRKLSDGCCGEIAAAARLLIETLKKGGKLILMGNGGSAADSQHIAAELVGRFGRERKPMAALALGADAAVLTALGNDYGFDNIFARQIEACCGAEDLVLALSTSGESPNLISGLALARKLGARTMAFLGRGGGKCKDMVDMAIVVPSNEVPRIQEAHITMGHIICQLAEEELSEASDV